MMMGDKISAQEAERLGMIYKYFSADTFSEASLQIADSLSKAATKGIAFTKMALNQSLQNDFEQQLQTEDHWQWQASQTNDFKEGINAFLEKRTPNFNGH